MHLGDIFWCYRIYWFLALFSEFLLFVILNNLQGQTLRVALTIYLPRLI
jgi:hypothetical protein